MMAQLRIRARVILWLTVAVVFVAAANSQALAQYNLFQLDSTSSPGSAANDPNLVNGWGLAFFPTSPFWVSDNGTGLSTLYDHSGTILGLVVTIPPAPSKPLGPKGTPTGIIANPTPGFAVTQKGHSGAAAFIFDTLDGTISGWSPGVDVTHAIIAVDNSASHAVYTGLAFATNAKGSFLFAADAGNNKIDVFDGKFHRVMSFRDPATPSGLSAYGIQNIGGELYVTFGSLVPNQGGAVDVFSASGKLLRRLITNGPGGHLEAPWGAALAPKDFGHFSNALLIGNVDDGHINAFDRKTGTFLGALKFSNGKDIAIHGLWALQFGAGSPANGDKNQLFFTAGPDKYRKGLFGMITANGTD
jgi:uncharacterized protein (TIGR03118 family)